MTKEEIKDNFYKIKKELPCNVRLCAVSKFHTVDEIKTAIETGQTLFGENHVQEACEKFTQIYNDDSIASKIELHIIGKLQSNKVKKAVEIASCIQSVDSKKLLEKIENAARNLNKNIDVYFELHTGEDSKSGFESKEELMECVSLCAQGNYPHVSLKGLMTMAPFTDEEEKIRASFRELRKLKEEINDKYSSLAVTELSMGMSGDYKTAIEEGSTMVRIGTALFGQRVY